MAPDTQQNLFYTLYFLIQHNALVFFYIAAIASVTINLLIRPTRGKVLILWGFIILLFVFEYNKHFLEPLKKQTIESIITQRQSVRIEYTITKFFTKIIPFVLPVLGWSLIVVGFVFDKLIKNISFIVKEVRR